MVAGIEGIRETGFVRDPVMNQKIPCGFRMPAGTPKSRIQFPDVATAGHVCHR
jgi:hypothetical protein